MRQDVANHLIGVVVSLQRPQQSEIETIALKVKLTAGYLNLYY